MHHRTADLIAARRRLDRLQALLGLALWGSLVLAAAYGLWQAGVQLGPR